eukprot:1030613-Alexandrium_andersonii.AAC.1
MIARIADWRIADWISLRFDFATWDPLKPCFHWRIRNLREEWRGAHPSRSRGTNVEAIPGPAQFQ